MAGNLTKQHTYGSGEISFARFLPNTQTPGPFRYLGNTTEFTLTSEIERLDHFDSDHGIREKDDSIVTSTTMSGTIVTDNINVENLALLFLGTSGTIVQASATGQSDTIAAIGFGTYQLGVTGLKPTGVRLISTVVVKDASAGSVTYVAGTDYVVDLVEGTITFIEGGTIEAGDPAYITYNVGASTRDQVVSGNQPIDGALRFKSFNAKGPQRNYLIPYVSMAPDGDFSLKGEDWLTIPFTLDVQRKGDLQRVYADGVAVAG